MEVNNQNSWNSFREKLQQATELPGENPFNADAAWVKLSERLEKKPVHRKRVYYWAAAATVLLLLTVVALNEKRNQVTPAGTSIALVPSQQKPKSSWGTEPVTPLITSAGAKPGNVIVKTKARKKVPVNIQPEKPATSQTTVILSDSTKDPELLVNEGTSASPAIPGIALQINQPKKLHVVHNNELNSVLYKPELSVTNAPVIPLPSTGHIRFSRNASDNILQIKLSLTN
ncbi:MAG TPA: hypothetical protein VLC28_03260 [Flavitalea sp.]|nr:hypothetical protein [Flavitalea sp.]